MKGKSPTPALHTIDNRGSHFYLAMYWAQHLAAQSKDIELADLKSEFFKEIADKESIKKEKEEVNASRYDPAEFLIIMQFKSKQKGCMYLRVRMCVGVL